MVRCDASLSRIQKTVLISLARFLPRLCCLTVRVSGVRGGRTTDPFVGYFDYVDHTLPTGRPQCTAGLNCVNGALNLNDASFTFFASFMYVWNISSAAFFF